MSAALAHLPPCPLPPEPLPPDPLPLSTAPLPTHRRSVAGGQSQVVTHRQSLTGRHSQVVGDGQHAEGPHALVVPGHLQVAVHVRSERRVLSSRAVGEGRAPGVRSVREGGG
jgi:hypothetical protein